MYKYEVRRRTPSRRVSERSAAMRTTRYICNTSLQIHGVQAEHHLVTHLCRGEAKRGEARRALVERVGHTVARAGATAGERRSASTLNVSAGLAAPALACVPEVVSRPLAREHWVVQEEREGKRERESQRM